MLKAFQHRVGSPFLSSTFPTHAAAKLLLPPVLSHRSSSSTTATSLPSMPAVTPMSLLPPPLSMWCKRKLISVNPVGGPTKQIIPEGYERLRAVCSLCGKAFYENPKMLLEIGESPIEGAARETLEEACAEVEVLSPFAQLDIPHIGQSYIIFRAKLKKPHLAPGADSLERALFNLDEIPFEALAFSSIFVTLKMYIEDVKMGRLKFHYCVINKRHGLFAVIQMLILINISYSISY